MRAAVRSFRTRSPAHKLYDLWTRTPRVIDWAAWVLGTCRARFPMVIQGRTEGFP
jgi:hypothetical protein